MQNNCGPARIYGPFERWTFLGLSIVEFSSSIGWNAQSGSLDITLVEDTCAGESRNFFDGYLTERTTTNADPGFVYPVNGSPVLFRCGDWEYSGLLQSYEENTNEGGNTWTVKIVDPSQILAGVQILIGDYAGTLSIRDVENPLFSYDVPNVINCYGFAEATLGGDCPLTEINGGTFGSPAGGFAGSVNQNGFRWNYILDSVSLLTSAFPKVQNRFSPYGRILFRGSLPSRTTQGVIPADFYDPNTAEWVAEYFVDLSALPIAPDYYRFSGTSISLLDAISQVCEDAGLDFYIELIPVRFGGQVLKIIKVRTALRRTQPTLGQISDFLSETDGANAVALGQELRSDNTSALVIGGPIESIYQATTESLIEPYWGLDSAGDVILQETFEDEDGITKFKFTVDIDGLNKTLHRPISSSSVTLYEDELRAALEGYDSWEIWQTSIGVDLEDSFAELLEDRLTGLMDIPKLMDFINKAAIGEIDLTPESFINLARLKSGNPRDKLDLVLQDNEAIYEFVYNYASNYFGRQFMVRVPYSCVAEDPESLQIVTTDSPNQSGWTEYPTVLDLPHPSIFTDFFGEETGKVECFVKFGTASQYDYTHLDTSNYGIFSNILYLKAGIDTSGFYYTDSSIFLSPRVVISLPEKVYERLEEGDIHRHAALIGQLIEINLFKDGKDEAEVAAFINDKLKPLMDKVGAECLHFGFSNRVFKPSAACIPMKSNVATYGPWYLAGPLGAVRIENDSGLVPWEYGSTEVLNQAGFLRASQDVTFMQTSETGTITIPGLPELPLGSELRHGAPAVIENRRIVTNNNSLDDEIIFIGLDEEKWTGLDGPNITGITCQVGQGGITTTYSMRTYTPKLGRFARSNAERLKQIGQLRLQQTKALRLAQFNIDGTINTRRLAFFLDKEAKKHRDRKDTATASTPVGIIVGQHITEAGSRTDINIGKFKDVTNELTADYSTKAMMSLDGLIRPISKAGDGDLAQYASPNAGVVNWISRQIEPPVETYTQLETTTRKLDPLLNPNDLKDGGGDTHHDIELLARGSEPPETSLILPVDEAVNGDEVFSEDYRFFGMRGPLVISGWGRDLDGKPIPNEADTGAELGSFTQNGLTDRYLNDWLRNPKSWATGPLDVRFDRERGVWTFPSGFRIVRVKLDEDIGPNTDWKALGKIIDGRVIENSDGEQVEKIITVYYPGRDGANPVTRKTKYAAAGDIIVAYYDSIANRYYGLTTGDISSTYGAGNLHYGYVLSYPTPGDKFSTIQVAPIDSLLGEPGNDDPITVYILIRHEYFSVPMIEPGRVIVYGAVPASDEEDDVDFVCLTDALESRLTYDGEILSESTPANGFADFQAKIYLKGISNGQVLNPVTVKNARQQPVLQGMTGYFYRNAFYGRSFTENVYADEWFLEQANFCKLCVVTDINIGENVQSRGSLFLEIKDRAIYLESAWTDTERVTGSMYLDSLDRNICITIASSHGTGCYHLSWYPGIQLTEDIKSECYDDQTARAKFYHCDSTGGYSGGQG